MWYFFITVIILQTYLYYLKNIFFINNYLQIKKGIKRLTKKPIKWTCDIFLSQRNFFFEKYLHLFWYRIVPKIRKNTPAFFPILETVLKRGFCYRQHHLFRFFFFLLNRSKTHSFHRCLQFWKEEKVSGGQFR